MAFVGPLSAGRTSLSPAGKPAQCQRRRLEWRRVVRCQSSHLLLGAEQLTPAVEIYGKLFFFAIGLVVSTFVSIFFVGFLASRNIEEVSTPVKIMARMVGLKAHVFGLFRFRRYPSS